MTGRQETSDLVAALCGALNEAAIEYCHWKSNVAIGKSASGENDLDLLVNRSQSGELNQILFRLGFRQLDAPRERAMPGVQDFLGFDAKSDRFIHVQAHYQLILGHDSTKNFRVPIEVPFLASASSVGIFRLPSVEYEYTLFIIRMIVKHSTWDAVLGRHGPMSASEIEELRDFRERVDHVEVEQIVDRHLPFLDVELFRACVRVVRGETGLWERVGVACRLESALQGHARYSRSKDLILRLWRRVAYPISRRLRRRQPKYRLSTGGTMVALIGGDGSGKSTAVNDLAAWLGEMLDVRHIHLGRPKRALATHVVRASLRLARMMAPGSRAGHVGPMPEGPELGLDGYSRLFWLAGVARDRYRVYRKARRFTTGGGIVISDRYPHPLLRSMDVPLIDSLIEHPVEGNLAARLSRLEKVYHDRISPSEVLVVLRVDPEVAVIRKTDETPESVRARCQELWEIDWSRTDAHVVDANQSREAVLSDLKSFVWSALA